jgi:hypothetical protein
MCSFSCEFFWLSLEETAHPAFQIRDALNPHSDPHKPWAGRDCNVRETRTYSSVTSSKTPFSEEAGKRTRFSAVLSFVMPSRCLFAASFRSALKVKCPYGHDCKSCGDPS